MFIPLPSPSDDHHDATNAIWIPVRAGTVFVEPGSGLVAGPQPGAGDGDHHFLGVLDGAPVWAVDLHDSNEEGDLEPVHLRKLYERIPEEHWIIAGRAEQIVNYERTHRFCGRCAAPTESSPSDRGRVCPDCKHMAFPRLSPAMIVLVEKGDQALLAWGRQFPGRFYSTLAGFVEPGESLEQAVEREVMEEVGITVNNIRYFGSQPWPFPHSLMCGFQCDYESGEIVIQEEEIVEANWYDPNDLPPCPVGGMSIAGSLIEDWLQRKGVQ
ncbi:MAG: NAD+ diphosphatase [Candidatus Poriferisodalaceae bacterium]